MEAKVGRCSPLALLAVAEGQSVLALGSMSTTQNYSMVYEYLLYRYELVQLSWVRTSRKRQFFAGCDCYSTAIRRVNGLVGQMDLWNTLKNYPFR